MSNFLIFIFIFIFSNLFLYINNKKRFLINKQKYAYVIRIHILQKEQYQRFIQWRKEIPNDYSCFIVMDFIQNVKIYNCNTIKINFQNVTEKYPNIIEIPRIKCANIQKKQHRFFMWAFHVEPIYIWYEQYGKEFDYVWIIEQDIGFSGNMYDFLGYFEDNNSDLLSLNVMIQHKKWSSFNCATENYIEYREKMLGSNSICYQSNEYIQRWSKRLFYEIGKCLKKDYHRFSESFPIEVVIMSNLTYDTFPDKFKSDKLQYFSRVTKQLWKSYFTDPIYKNKLIHGLKF